MPYPYTCGIDSNFGHLDPHLFVHRRTVVKKTNRILKSLRTVIYVRPAFKAVLRIRKFALKMPYISSLTFKKDVQAPGEDSSPLKSSSNIKKFIFFPFSETSLACLDPDPNS